MSETTEFDPIIKHAQEEGLQIRGKERFVSNERVRYTHYNAIVIINDSHQTTYLDESNGNLVIYVSGKGKTE